MSNKKKRLCKLERDKTSDKDSEFIEKIKDTPLFRCERCGRVANAEEWLHEPAPLKDS